MEKFKCVIRKLVLILFVVSAGLCSVPPDVKARILSQAENIDDCQACKEFVESFKTTLGTTAQRNHEGGNVAFVEQQTKSYKGSNILVVDSIGTGMCKEVSDKSKQQCHKYSENSEELIEKRWAQEEKSDDLYTYICIDNLKLCCPKHHYGKDCIPCPGDSKNFCSGNGECHGDGTRKGTGTCECYKGYTGVSCELCDIGYYLSYKDANKILCSPCHKFCLGACRGRTQRDCEVCKPGIIFDRELGCLDINKCKDRNICKKNEFCYNTLDSYICLRCDEACDGCYGKHSGMCKKCAVGYIMKNKFCVLDRPYEDELDKKLRTARNNKLQKIVI